nr:probable peroxisomal membrane protein - fission yeast (Schizosaccharomyces pombe) [Schizosaccharomyces pombe]
MLNSMPARDKTFRALQFVAKLLSWHLFYGGSSLSTVNKWKKLESNISFSRKLFSIGKVLDYICKVYFDSLKLQNPLSGNKSALPTISFTKDVAFAGYATAELIGWFNKTELMPCSHSKQISTIGKQCLAVALLSSCLAGCYELQQNSKKIKSATQEASEKDSTSLQTLQKERKEILFFALQNALDATIPLAELDILKVNDGFVAAAGITTSLMSVYKTWIGSY